MIARLMIPGLAALLLAPAWATAQDDDHFGTYSYVKGQRGKQAVPEENLKDSKVKVEEGKISLLGAGGEVEFEIRYTIDEDQGGEIRATLEIVKAILDEAVGSKAKALAKHEGDTITLIYDVEGTDYPADFEPDGPSQHLFVIKKAGPAAEAEAPKPDPR